MTYRAEFTFSSPKKSIVLLLPLLAGRERVAWHLQY